MEISVLHTFSWKAVPGKTRLREEQHSGRPVILSRDEALGLRFSPYVKFDRNLTIIKTAKVMQFASSADFSSHSRIKSKLSL